MIKLAIIDGCEKNVDGLLRIVKNYFGDREHSVSVFSSAMVFNSQTVYPPPPPRILIINPRGITGRFYCVKNTLFTILCF